MKQSQENVFFSQNWMIIASKLFSGLIAANSQLFPPRPSKEVVRDFVLGTVAKQFQIGYSAPFFQRKTFLFMSMHVQWWLTFNDLVSSIKTAAQV